jgi:predicted amidohydrolase YtcJ
MQFAVTRVAEGGRAFRPDLAMNRLDAARVHTRGGAVQQGAEAWRGTIEHGMAADFQVLGEDVFACPAERIAEAPVDMTVVAGEVVFER